MGARAIEGFATIAAVMLSQRWLIPAPAAVDAGGMFERTRRGEAARIRARYGHRLAETRIPTKPTEEFEVPTFDALLLLADEHGTKVSCVPDPTIGRDLYFVDDGAIRYRYRAAPRRRAVPRAVTV